MHLNTPAVSKTCHCGLAKRSPHAHHQQSPVWTKPADSIGQEMGKGLNQQTPVNKDLRLEWGRDSNMGLWTEPSAQEVRH